MNSPQKFAIIFFTSGHYYFFEKLKIEEKILLKLNYSYGKVSYALKAFIRNYKNYTKIKTTKLQKLQKLKIIFESFKFKTVQAPNGLKLKNSSINFMELFKSHG